MIGRTAVTDPEVELIDNVQHTTPFTTTTAVVKYSSDSPPVDGISMTLPRNHFRGHTVRRTTVRVRLLAVCTTSSTHDANSFPASRLQLLRATQVD